jgi:hypothetical protein
MARSLVCVATFAVALTRVSGAQVEVAPTELQTVVLTLATAATRVPESLRSPQLISATQWLQGNVKKTRASDVSREYVSSLERAAQVLSSATRAEVVEDVTRELEAKVQHCRSLGVSMGGSVLLRVNTRRAARVVGDWQVLYLLKFDEWLKTPPRNFLRVSSPTEMNVEPGRYWIWARDPATGTTSDRVLVEVAGRKELLLDLPVP